MRKYTKVTCAYCDEEVGNNKLPAHERVCPGNPDVSAALLQFITDRSRFGKLMTLEEYEASPNRGDLPSTWTIRKYYGSWQNFADWCGLNMRRRVRNTPYNEYIPALDNPDIPRVAQMQYDPYPAGMQATRALRLQREWDPKRHTYVPSHWQVVSLIR